MNEDLSDIQDIKRNIELKKRLKEYLYYQNKLQRKKSSLDISG